MDLSLKIIDATHSYKTRLFYHITITLFCQIIFTDKQKYDINKKVFTVELMSLYQRISLFFIVPLLAFFSIYKKKPVIPSPAHLPPTAENAGPLERMFQGIPCEEGRGVGYSILDDEGIRITCVPSPQPVEI